MLKSNQTSNQLILLLIIHLLSAFSYLSFDQFYFLLKSSPCSSLLLLSFKSLTSFQISLSLLSYHFLIFEFPHQFCSKSLLLIFSLKILPFWFFFHLLSYWVRARRVYFRLKHFHKKFKFLEMPNANYFYGSILLFIRLISFGHIDFLNQLFFEILFLIKDSL